MKRRLALILVLLFSTATVLPGCAALAGAAVGGGAVYLLQK